MTATVLQLQLGSAWYIMPWLETNPAWLMILFFFFQAEDGIRDADVTGVQTCALPIWSARAARSERRVGDHLRADLRDREAAPQETRRVSGSAQARGDQRARVRGLRRLQIGRASCRERV